jgi:hypothetical protein
MESVDRMNPEIARLFTAKQERRRQLAALPFPNKVRLVVQLQRRRQGSASGPGGPTARRGGQSCRASVEGLLSAGMSGATMETSRPNLRNHELT